MKMKKTTQTLTFITMEEVFRNWAIHKKGSVKDTAAHCDDAAHWEPQCTREKSGMETTSALLYYDNGGMPIKGRRGHLCITGLSSITGRYGRA
jgi:hypothetical protein